MSKIYNELVFNNIRESLITELSESRYKHTIGVEYTAASLAMKYQYNIEKARTARQLIFIRDYFGGEWIEKNGLNIAKALLTKTIHLERELAVHSHFSHTSRRIHHVRVYR